jgi:pimeloyl-ACP methyl ester carboxylesterase
MPDWIWLAVAFICGPVPIGGTAVLSFYLYYRWKFRGTIVRIFEEKPLFIIPRGTPIDGAECVDIPVANGLKIRGTYIRHYAGERKGVILFGLEFGSDRWASHTYCEGLLQAGYDVFTYEPRNQGDSDTDATYEPLQWVTDRDAADQRAALKYLHSRPDRDPFGIGLFGVSKGGALALLAAAEDPLVRCVATDGAFGTYTTMIPFMRRWVHIYIKNKRNRNWVPDWFYGLLGLDAIAQVEKKRRVKFESVERAVRRLRQPLLMIHGGGDTYIKPEMALALHKQAKTAAKELWVVEKAKHNQAIQLAGDEYHQRVVEFFDRHLANAGVAEGALAAAR